MTNRTVPALLSCAAALLIAGCGSSGSSGSSSSSSSSTGTPTPTTESSSTVAAPPSSGPGPVRSGVVNIRYEGIAVNPSAITVREGSTIKWTNYDQTPHNVTTQGSGAANFVSKDFNTGKTYTYKATVPGVIHYLCSIHPASMTGTITVVKKK